jgi:hypothetical protein
LLLLLLLGLGWCSAARLVLVLVLVLLGRQATVGAVNATLCCWHCACSEASGGCDRHIERVPMLLPAVVQGQRCTARVSAVADVTIV